MKRIMILAVGALMSLGVAAQSLKVSDFYGDGSDISAAVERVDDLNGEPCALVKVNLSVENPIFEGDVVKSVSKGKSEYWVYMVDGSGYLNVKTDDYPALRYDFPESVKSQQTYIMDIVRPGENPARRVITLKYDDGTDEGAVYKMNMILCKAGRFEMGDSRDVEHAESDAKQHWVRLTRDFYIGECEVTQDLWEFVMGVDANNSTKRGAKLPVDNVSYELAQQFITSINKMVNLGVLRLPTEAEWEYAARGAHKMTRTKYAGSDKLEDVAWYYENAPDGMHKVMQKAPNEVGIYDMSGNVWELCQDWKEDYKSKEVTDPQGPVSGKMRLRRGGSYDSKNYDELRVDYRRRVEPGRAFPAIGLRLVWTR